MKGVICGLVIVLGGGLLWSSGAQGGTVCHPAVASQPWPSLSAACQVAQCESGGDPDAVSTDGLYHSLFQLDEHIMEPYANAARAYERFVAEGAAPWLPGCGRFFSVQTTSEVLTLPDTGRVEVP